MKKSVALLLLLGLVAFAAITPVAYAEEGEEAEEEGAEGDDAEEEEDEDEYLEDDVDEHPLTDMPLPKPDVITVGVLPFESMENPRLPIGKPVDALIGIVNDGQDGQAINVTMIMGSLNSPFDFNYYIQNFSSFPYGIIVQEGEEFSFHYRFQSAMQLDPVDYQVALTVFYENEDELFSHTFFNESVSFYEDSALIDLEATFKTVGGLAAVALVGLMFFKIAAGSSEDAAASNSTNGTEYSNDWDYNSGTGAETTTAGRKYANKGRAKRRSGRKNK